ncbi:MAG TPA: mechanosensitive ion channel family protein [Chitinophagaceae bacterium]|nr:mechanosensitive ion channel family protein [Chitinophagaceae bacterium]
MMNEHDILILAIYISAAFIIGLIVQKLIIPFLSSAANYTRWKSDDIIINSIRPWVLFWFVLAGISIAFPAAHVPDTFSNIGQKIIITCVIFSITWVIARIIAQFITHKTSAEGTIVHSTSIISNILRIIIYTIGFLFLLQSLGISITPLLTALGVSGLAVALALQETLTNLFAGVQIIASGKIKPNDYIQLNTGEEGYVEDIAWRSTTVRALSNNIIIIPNSKLAGTIVRNFSLPENEIAVLVNLGVSYSSDLDKVEKITIEVAAETLKEVQGGVAEFAPFIRYNKFNNSSIDFTVILRGKEFTDQYLIQHEFIKRLQKRYLRENVEIPFPIRTIYMK